MNTTRAQEHQQGTRLRVLALISDAESAGDLDWPVRSRVKFLRAADAFDRRDHIMSAPAHLLHLKATLNSAVVDHPGFVPDEYVASLTVEDLHSPGTDPAVLATELCSDGMWRRTDGGYRVLDWPAVQGSIDHVRELRTVDQPAGNRERPERRGQGQRTVSSPPPEFDTRIPHWFGPADDQPAEILSLLSGHGDHMHVRAAATVKAKKG